MYNKKNNNKKKTFEGKTGKWYIRYTMMENGTNFFSMFQEMIPGCSVVMFVGSSPSRVTPRTMKLVFAVSLLNTKH